MKPLATFLLLAAVALGQAPPPRFEVAAIRPAAPLNPQAPLIGMQIDGARVRIGLADLDMLIRTAYNVRDFQIEGPDWVLDSDVPVMYDVEATMPSGATPDQVPAMLQTLLKDRFKLQVHKGSKTVQTYVLLTGKDGARIPAASGDPEPPPRIGARGSVTQGANGETVIVRGPTKITTAPGRGERIETSTTAALADYLAQRLQQSVVDKTGLSGAYDIKLEILPANLRAALGDLPKDPKELLAYLDAHHEDIQDATVASQQAALAKLGLKLEKQKASIETLVIDHIEKTPTDN